MFIKQETANNLIAEANTIRDNISDELKVFICLLNDNGNFLFEIMQRYFNEEPLLHEVINIINNINKLGCFLKFSEVPINKFKKLHASRDELELFHLVRGLRISYGVPLLEIMEQLKQNEIDDCLNISAPITSFSRKYEEKSKHSIKNINIAKYDGDDKIRLEWEDKSKTHLLVLPDDSKLLITKPNHKEKALDFIDFEGKIVVNVEFKSFKFIESRDDFSVISLLLLSYNLIHNIYQSNFDNIDNKNLWDKLANVVQLLQKKFLSYLISDKFKVIKQVNAGRQTSALQELIMDKFDDVMFDYIRDEVTLLLNNNEITTPSFVGKFMLKIWSRDFETVLKLKKKYNFKHNLYNGSKTFQSLIEGLERPTENARYKDLCHMVICELQERILNNEAPNLNFYKFKDIFVELCISNLHFVKQMQNVMNENSLSINCHRQYLQTIKNGVA